MTPAFDELPLVPAPAFGRMLAGKCVVGSDAKIFLPTALAHFLAPLKEALAGFGETSADRGVAEAEIAVSLDSAHGGKETDEGYTLAVAPGRVTLCGATEAGVFRGLQTFFQLLEGFTVGGKFEGLAGACELPCLEIKDAPAFAWRGIMLDVARHFLTVPEIKAFLDRLARLKFNVFHWHLTDDQGWRVEIKSRPELTTIGAVRAESPIPGDAATMDGTPYGPFFYTRDDIREIVAHAQARSIVVVPEIDLPGHVRAVLACYPELGCTRGPYTVRSDWGIEEEVLCLGNPASLDFVRDVLGEICELFPGPFVHIGGDEAPDGRWLHCPCCREAARQAGLASPKALQKTFTRAIERFLAERGKRAVGWDEILDESPSADTVIASWRGAEGGIRAAATGNDAIMCPFTHCYLDYRDSEAPGQVLGAPNGLVTTLEKCYSYEPRDPGLTPEQAAHIIGVQGNLWTEYMWSAEDVNRMAFPRAHALAEIGWSPAERRDFPSFLRRLGKLRRPREKQPIGGREEINVSS